MATVEVGDMFEFCKVEDDGFSHAYFGKVIKINTETRTFDFMRGSSFPGKEFIEGGSMHDRVVDLFAHGNVQK